MAISQGLAWSLANGITQEQYDKNIVDAIKRYEQQGYTDAQYESLMNQWGISAEDVARATGSRVQDIQARMQAATPTTPTEVEFERAAQAELGQRQAQAAAQERQNEIDWAAQQKRNEEEWAAQQKRNAEELAEQQRQNELAWAEQQRINEIRNREQIAANEKESNMAISQGLAWSLANGITQEQYDKNIVDAIKRYEQQGYTDAQYESLMNQWGISAEDVARATGSRVQDIQARMQAATPTTPTEVEFERAAQAELRQRQAQAAAQQRQNEIDWAAQQKRNAEEWAAKQRQNEIDWAEQQRINEIRNREQIAANEKAWAEQQRQNELAWAEQQRQNELAWAEQQRQNAVEWARQQALLNQGATGVGQFGAPGTFAQNFQNYMEIPIGAQYNPAVTPGGASPYSLVRAQMQPMQNPYAGFVAGTPMGGYDPNVYNTLLRQVDQEVLKNAIDEGLIGTAGGDSVGSGDAGADGGFSGMSNSGEGGEGGIGGWADGGLIDRVGGPNPPGKDDGLGMLQLGEYVIKKSSVDKYGKGLLDMINAGKVPAKKIKSLLD